MSRQACPYQLEFEIRVCWERKQVPHSRHTSFTGREDLQTEDNQLVGSRKGQWHSKPTFVAVEHGLETGRLPLVGVFDGMRWKIQDKEAGGNKYGKIGKLNLDLV